MYYVQQNYPPLDSFAVHFKQGEVLLSHIVSTYVCIVYHFTYIGYRFTLFIALPF